jgi:hypothetical protein
MSGAEKVINWSEVSRLLTGDRTYLRKSYTGIKYSEAIKDLEQAIEVWTQKHVGK